MVTERDLLAQAKIVRSHLETVRDSSGSIPDWIANTGLVGGSYQQQLVGGLATQSEHTKSLVEALGDLAEDLEQRAKDCAEYRKRLEFWRQDLQRWESAASAQRTASMLGMTVPSPGVAPSPPSKPFPEAEAD